MLFKNFERWKLQVTMVDKEEQEDKKLDTAGSCLAGCGGDV